MAFALVALLKRRCYKAVEELRRVPLEETLRQSGSLRTLKGPSVGGLGPPNNKKVYRKKQILLLFSAEDVQVCPRGCLFLAIKIFVCSHSC